jgi:DNA repair exonuclease SbcCD ATPase subunit
MSANEGKEVAPDTELREGANVDKIRDILFGSQMRDYEKRFQRLEERLTKDAESLRDELKKRFDTLENYAHQEIEAVGQRLKTEKSERTDAVKELSKEMRELHKALEKKLAQLDDVMTESTTELRKNILDQSKALTTEIATRTRELAATLDREVKALREEKTDREGLADLLTEMAMRLRKEFELPTK